MSKQADQPTTDPPSDSGDCSTADHCTRCGYPLTGGTCDNGCDPISAAIRVGNLLDQRPDDARVRSLPRAMNLAEQLNRKDPHATTAVWIGSELHRVLLREFVLMPE